MDSLSSAGRVYFTQGDTMDAKIQLDEEVTPDGDRLVRALLVLTGSPPPDDERRPGLNLALVLDRSGSMQGDKLSAAKRAAAGLVRRLSPRDVVGVVAYDDTVTTVAEPATGEHQEDLAARIESIDGGGTTNLSGGWLRGREMVGGTRRAAGDARSIDRVILLTDGLANVGITDPATLTGLTAQAARAGVTTTTIGFGEGFNEDLLRAMADAGGGSTYYIEAADQAGDVFAEELSGLLSMSAQNVRVSITPAGEWVGGMTVRHDFPATAAGSTLTCELGDLYAREPRRLLVQALVRLSDDASSETAVFEIVVHADVVLADGSMEHRTVTLPVTVSRSGPAVSVEVKREALLLDAAEARRRAREAERTGDVQGARMRLREVSARLARELPADDEVREQADDLALMAQRLEDIGSFDPSDRKYMAQREYDVMRSKRAFMEKTSRVRREKRGPEA